MLADEKTGKNEFDYTLPMCLGLVNPKIELPLEWDSNGYQVKDNLIATEPCHSATCLCGTMKIADIYGPLMDHLKETRDLHIFAYDWRYCLDETALKFEKFLAEVKETTGQRPQVVGHSMGCLITLNVLNRHPELFHSILFGAGAMAPNATVIADFSMMGGKNVIVKNSTTFTPKINLSNPSILNCLAYPGERKLFGKSNTVLFRDENNKPIELDLHSVETWKKHKVGLYHPDSGVDEVDATAETWLQVILDKVHKFRNGLLPANSGLKPSSCPPIAVLRGDHTDTDFSYIVRSDGIDLKNDIQQVRGDGRVALEDTVPPKDIPVCKIVTNDREHSEVLNDLQNVDMLLNLLIDESRKK